MASDESPRCSFCGKSQDAVERLVSGRSAYICGECVAVCTKMLEMEEVDREDRSESP